MREREREGEKVCQKCYYIASSPLERRGYPSHFFGLSQPSLTSLYNVISRGPFAVAVISFSPFLFSPPQFSFISLPRFFLSVSLYFSVLLLLLLLLDLLSS